MAPASAPPTAPRRPNPARARRLGEEIQGLLMIAVLAFGAWQGVGALLTPPAQRRLAQSLDLHSFLTGRTAAAINAIEAHDLPIDPALRAIGGVFRWRLFGSGGPQVRVGCDDWLFLTEELRSWPDAEANLRARVALLKAIADRLSARGVELVVAVTPDKARVEAAHLCGAPRTRQADRRYGEIMALLRANRIAAIDLAAPLIAAARSGPVYLRTDSHWSQPGAALAAERIAEAVKIPIDRGYAFATERAATATLRPGDLLRLMSLDRVPDLMPRLRPRPDQLFVERTVQTAAPASGGDLLDAGPGGQIVLLGSSYALNSNFHGRLQQALQTPIDNRAEAGGGFAGSAEHYFGGESFADTPPRLVIWEMPERTLVQPLDASDRALMRLAPSETQAEQEPDHGSKPGANLGP